MLVQLAIFAAAASIHFGLLLHGYGHRAAGTAESVIAAVLLLGLVFTWLPARLARVLAIGAQSFATVGVLVGLFTIAIGVGPRTALDLSIHGAMLVALIAGLTITLRVRPRRAA
ncbi:MAG TPA: hypothetical protein VEK82_02825 [Stellaceae bacterium]|nr:hypothetical protein [Stellaceae bacterium]